jgi:putative hydrolase of the HAD superfamily
MRPACLAVDFGWCPPPNPPSYSTCSARWFRVVRVSDAVAYAVANELEIDPGELAQLFRDTFEDRTTGRLGDMPATIVELAARLGACPDARLVDRAVQRRLEMTRALFRASWALPVLDRLRAENTQIGVVSDCSAETPAVWADSPLAARVDATAFSCVVGVRKPDPAMYLTVTTALNVSPERCIFVGDGASAELSGARTLGMRAIWFDNVGRPDRPARCRGRLDRRMSHQAR